MYLWYFKKKGVNVGNPQHKNTVSGSDLCCHNKEMLAKSAHICLSGRHVANMLATFPAKPKGTVGLAQDVYARILNGRGSPGRISSRMLS